MGNDPDGTELGDFIEDLEAEKPAEIAGRNLLHEEVDEILNELAPRQTSPTSHLRHHLE
ncbi:MAG: hypothetical protein ACE5E7_08295 [Anaerolineae bacterium]